MFGTVTVDGWIAHKKRTGKELHVLVDGVDVTADCFRANDRKGYAFVHLRNANGRFYIGPDGRAAKRILRGTVRIVEA